MAQFDVHRNVGRQKEIIPFVVVAQSPLFDGYRRRVVIPLVRKAQLGQIPNPRLNPTFRVKGISVVPSAGTRFGCQRALGGVCRIARRGRRCDRRCPQ